MDGRINRRETLKSIGVAAAAVAGVAALAPSSAAAAAAGEEKAPRDYLKADAQRLRQLYRTLWSIPRQRGAAGLPMVLTRPAQWDAAPLAAILAYADAPRQVFDATDLAGTWITQIRNTMNAQAWAFGEPDFLLVAAPHGPAGYALLTQAAWKKYGIAALTDGAFKRNTLIEDPKFKPAAVNDPEDRTGLYSDAGATIPVLQRRGVVFCACHNALWELAGVLIANGSNPDGRTQRELVADLTDALIPGVVTTPGNEAVIGNLQRAGFAYSFAEA